MLTFRTNRAMRIARVNPDRFNEAVAATHYPCAPKTRPGMARVFDEADLIGLYAFGRLLDFGVTPRKAGEMACSVVERVKQDSKPEKIVFASFEGGINWVLNFDDSNLDGRVGPGGRRTELFFVIHLANLREILAAAMVDDYSEEPFES